MIKINDNSPIFCAFVQLVTLHLDGERVSVVYVRGDVMGSGNAKIFLATIFYKVS